MREYNLREFLKETEYCDVSNVDIYNISKQFGAKYSNKSELAVKLFYFVRNLTLYRIGNWTKRASETLKEGSGACTNNANLLVALLRANGIPAGYGVMTVKGAEYFGPIALSHFTSYISKKSKHIYCCVFLHGRWLRCDPSDDEPLSLNTQHLNPQSKMIHWDGSGDALLNFDKQHIISDEWPIADIDYLIKKKQRYTKLIPVYFANKYITFLRETGRSIKSLDELEPKFIQWLLQKHLFDFIIYYSYFTVHKLLANKLTKKVELTPR